VTDRHFVEWQPQWDSRTGELRVYNRGTDDAHDVRLLVVVADAHTVQGFEGPITPSSFINVNLPGVAQQRAELAAEYARTSPETAAIAPLLARSDFATTLRVTVTWSSAAGLPKSQTVDFAVT
jgi:hypothetical protein